MYRSLNADSIIMTTTTLRNRVEERFPERGITRVAIELEAVALDAKAKAEWISKPLWPLRVGIGLIILSIILVTVTAIINLDFPEESFTITDFIQVLEAGINDVLLIGAAIFFLVTGEDRIKRNRALSAMRELRALAHVIDMHQLTKDPDRLQENWQATASSPVNRMTAFELTRYLDYCAEMLSIIGKIAALYIQPLDDPGVLNAVDEIEDLTTGLSRKIWQKIVILKATDEQPATYL